MDNEDRLARIEKRSVEFAKLIDPGMARWMLAVAIFRACLAVAGALLVTAVAALIFWWLF